VLVRNKAAGANLVPTAGLLGFSLVPTLIATRVFSWDDGSGHRLRRGISGIARGAGLTSHGWKVTILELVSGPRGPSLEFDLRKQVQDCVDLRFIS
jgi:hypothetical protein